MLFVIILGGVVGFLLYWIYKPQKNYWEAYGVRQMDVGDFKDGLDIFLGKKTIADLDDRLYHMMQGPSEKFCGIIEMQRPIVVIKDLDIVKKVLIKDFDHFTDRRGFASNGAQAIVRKMIANLEGEEWKGVRSSLSPTFTTGKIRRMMGYFNQVGNEWMDHLKTEIQKSGSDSIVIDVVNESNHYTIDVIAASVFGMDAGTIRNPNSKFSKMCQKISATNLKAILKFVISTHLPRVAEIIRLKLFDVEALAYFEEILAQGMKERMEGRVKANDFLQLVAEARKGDLQAVGRDELTAFEKDAQISTGTKKNWLSDDDVANAQMVGFFFAGFSTTSNFIGFCLYCLALNPEVQKKLRDGVDSQLFADAQGENIDYDKVNQSTYLEMFSCEVLRKYAPLYRLERKCIKEYYDPETGLRVPREALLAVPVMSIHNDPKYYEQPDKFYPEHFTPEKKAQRNPYAYLPFGSGPRNCIGMRFALVKCKTSIAHLVHNFFIEPSPKTPIPIKVQPVGFGVQIPANLELKLRQRNFNTS